MSDQPFAFKKHLSIGNAAAEEDKEFLTHCFVHTGDIDAILDHANTKTVLLGRTGSGKSAVIEHIVENEENVIRLEPESLLLNYISNSDIISFFERMNVDLDIFYQMLWRHILAVELIKLHYGMKTEANARGTLSWLAGLLARDPKKKQAVDYLQQWGSHFWIETDSRVREIVRKLERELKAAVDATDLGLPLTGGSASKVASEIREEVIHRAQRVVNEVQMQQLHQVIRLMAEDIFDDPKKRYYVLMDKLDEKWVDDSIRYKLIRALIESIKTFRNIPNVKIVVALRSDLLDRVFAHTRDSGFQEEKYESVLLRLSWTREQLKELLDRRIQHMVKKQYSGGSVDFAQLFPNKVNGIYSLITY